MSQPSFHPSSVGRIEKIRGNTPVCTIHRDCYNGMKPVEVANAVIEVAGLG